MRNKNALIAGMIAGITSPGSIGAASPYRTPQGTDLQRMRSDVAAVAGDFSTVLRRQNGKRADGKSNKG